MKTHYKIFAFIVILAALLSCSEDHNCEEGIIEAPNSVNLLSAVEYNQNLLDCRTPRIQNFTFPGFEGGVFLGDQGTQIIVNPQSIVDQNGNPVDQNVTLELIEMYQPGEVIACQLSTNGLSTTNTPEPLLSEGIYYLNLTVADPTITLNVASPIQLFGPSENDQLILRQFNSLSCQELDCRVLWENNPNTEVIPTTIEGPTGETISGYRTFVSILGWLSIARYNPDDNARTIIYNKATPQYAGNNSDTFFLYNNSSLGISLFERFDTSNEVFSEIHRQIPTTTSGSFILTTVQEGLYRYGNEQTTIEMNTIGLTTQTSDVSEADFIAQINNLQ